MSLAMAGTIADGEVLIRGVDNVNTSFPGFEDCVAGWVRMFRWLNRTGEAELADQTSSRSLRSTARAARARARLRGASQARWAATCSTAARSTGWWRWPRGCVQFASGHTGCLADLARRLDVRFDEQRRRRRADLAGRAGCDADELRSEEAGAGASRGQIPAVREALL